jgi:hypothetical protein
MTSGNNQSTVGEAIKAIASVIGLMMAVFTLLGIFLPAGLTQPIGAVIIGLIVTAILVWMGKLNWGGALLTWLAVSVGLIILYLIVSRPATVVGLVVDSNDAPVKGLTLVLTDANGVDHKTVSDENGAFEINNVSEGKFTVSANGELLMSGRVPSGWKRIVDPQVNIGSPVYKPSSTVATTPTVVAVVISDTPTPTPVVPTDTPSPPPTPTQTPVLSTPTRTPIPPTDTPTPTPPNTPTNTPISEPTSTNTPAPTPFYCTKSGSGGTETIEIELPRTISEIHIDLEERATGYGFSLYEVRVYGPDTGDRNLAIGATAEASSVQDDFSCIQEECKFTAHKAIDGDMNTRWSSDFLDEQWFKITLSMPQVVSRIELRWEAAYARQYCVTLTE